MKKSIILVVILFSAINIYSQSKTDTTKQKPYKFYKNSFQFRIQQFLTLSDFQGGLVSYKYHFNNHNAFRFGLRIQVDNNNTDEKKNDFIGSNNYSNNSDLTNVEYRLSSQFLYYLNPLNDIKFYLGLGPTVSFSKNSNNSERNDINNDNTNKSTGFSKFKIYSLGISAAYGVEWFFSKKLSLIAEYGFAMFYYKSESNSKNIIYDKNGKTLSNNSYSSSSSGFKFNSSGINFGLSVYF